ncbi:MAG: hypothetical protein M3N82_05455 [Pseudomonadota bacterium]|nr:hypothetical protein [Pseudomonadota bacterium]
MSTVDPSIPLAGLGAAAQAWDPQKLISMQELAQRIRAGQQQVASQNALRTIFADPANMGPTGELRPEAVAQVMQVDPKTGMQLREQMQTNRVQDSEVQRNHKLMEEADVEARMKKAGYIEENVRAPALIAYREAIRNGIAPAQAAQVAQTEFNRAIEAARGSGIFSEEEQDRLPKAFDYQRVSSNSQSFKAYVTEQEKKKADDLAAQKEAERARHDLEVEKSTATRETRMERLVAQRAADPNAALDDDTKTFMAQQYLSGDKSVLGNLGRGVQGSRNILELRKEIVRQAKASGKDASEVSAALAEFEGLKAGERTAATRGANVEMAVSEASKFANLALDASKASSRTGFVPLNKVGQMVERGTGDTNIVTFDAANTSFINAYARAVSPSGTPTVEDKKHAREMLSTAQTNDQYAAVIGQLQKEMKAAQQAPGEVKGAMRDLHTGKSKDNKHPADIDALLKKYGGQ